MLTNPGAVTLGTHLAMNDTVSFIQCTGNLEAIAKMHLQRECICCTGIYTILESCLTVCMKLTHRLYFATTVLAELCRIPLPRGNSSSDGEPAYVDWLYLDDDLRVTRGSKGSMFVHTKS